MILFVYKANVFIDKEINFSSLLYSICKRLNSFFSAETQKKICPMVRKKPYLSPLLKNANSQMTLELKPRMGKFSLLYGNVAPKWNTMI